jgi:hypothetical protein
MANTRRWLTESPDDNEQNPRASYRPRGALNIRDSSQIGITITAPSRK